MPYDLTLSVGLIECRGDLVGFLVVLLDRLNLRASAGRFAVRFSKTGDPVRASWDAL